MTFSDEILTQSQISEEELKLELAAILYKRKRVSIGQAARFAGITIFEMHEALAEREIDLNITPEDIVKDVQTSKRLRPQ